MKQQRGFTIIELVIVIALCLVLMSGLLALLDWHNKVFVLEQATVRATSSVRNVMNAMTRYVTQGATIEASRTMSGTLYTTDGDTVVVKIPSIDASGNVIAGTFDYFVYYLSSGSVYQLIEAGAGSVRNAGSKVLGESIDLFTLTYNNADPAIAGSVAVDVQARVTTRGTSSATTRATDTIFLRNR